MHTPRRLLVLTGATLASIALASPAQAAPPTEPFSIDCEGIGELLIVTPPGQGLFTPGWVVGSRTRLIPYSFTFAFPGMEPETVSKGNIPDDAITCTAEGGAVTVVLDVRGPH